MAADETVRIAFRAEMREFTKALKDATGITEGEAKKMAISLEKSMKKAETASKKAAKASKNAWKGAGSGARKFEQDAKKATASVGAVDNAMLNLGRQASDVGVQLAAGTSPMTVLIQQGPQLAESFSSASLAAAVLGRALAFVPVVAALTTTALAGAAAWTTYKIAVMDADDAAGRVSARLGETKTRLDKARDAVKGVNTEWTRFVAMGADLEAQIDLINGTTDKFTIAAEKQGAAATKAARSGILEQSQLVEAIRDRVKANDAAIHSDRLSLAEFAQAQAELPKLRAELQAAERGLLDKKAAAKAVAGDIATLTEYNRELAESEATLKTRTEAETAARQRQATANDLAAKAAREVAAATEALTRISLEASAGGLSAEGAVLRLRQQQLDAIDVAIEKEGDWATAVIARAEVEAQADRELLAIKESRWDAEDKRLDDTVKAMSDAAAKANDESLNEMKQAEERAQAQVLAMATMAGATSTIMQTAATANDKLTRKQAKRLWQAGKAAAFTEVAFSTAAAVMKVTAQTGVVAPLVIPAVLAAGAAQVAVIAAQKPPAFDIGGLARGGIASRTPDQVSARILPGEAVLNRSATAQLGESGVNRLNRGDSGSQFVAVPMYQHWNRFSRDAVRAKGPLRRELRRGRKIGALGY